MQEKLIESVGNVASSPVSVASVSVSSIGAGIGAYLELLSPIVGLLAAMAGLTLSLMLAYKTYMDIKIKKVQLEDLEEHHNGFAKETK